MFPLSDRNKLPGSVFLTYMLIALNAYVFYVELTTRDLASFIAEFALVPASFTLANPFTWLPLITSQFLHGGWFHILSNMWFLAVFGPNLEKAWGPVRFLAYYLLFGVAAAFMQLLFTVDPTVPVLGASGAIAGLLGAYLVYFPGHRITTLVPLGFIPLFIGIPASIVLIYWFALQVVGGLIPETVSSGGIAFFAHIGGFMAGVVFAAATQPRVKFDKYL